MRRTIDVTLENINAKGTKVTLLLEKEVRGLRSVIICLRNGEDEFRMVMPRKLDAQDLSESYFNLGTMLGDALDASADTWENWPGLVDLLMQMLVMSVAKLQIIALEDGIRFTLQIGNYQDQNTYAYNMIGRFLSRSYF